MGSFIFSSMRYRNLSHSLDEFLRRLHVFLGKRNLFNAFWWGVKVGRNLKFDGKCYFKRYPESMIRIGDNCDFRSRINSNLIGINRPCSISTLTPEAKIEIGKKCGFSGTVIGDNVWLGINVVVLKGVTIGDNTLIGANSVLTKDIPSNVIAAGNPCKLIKSIE